ncbi:MAG: hypothetical protein GWP06_00365 [Actinobacteria bacterium]|nr:hypothetical protein [Actinomycetota bacterium]
MSRNLSRATIDTLLPRGDLWEPEFDEGFDQQLDGISDETEDIRQVLNSLANIRNPSKTPVFEDLERNYGIKPNSHITDDIRLARLSQKVYQGEKLNSLNDLQAELITAGFDLQVHKNDPPVDPATFLTKSFQIAAGSDFAFAGYNNGVDILAFAASLGGELLVNTPIGQQSPAIEMQAGGAFGYAGFTSDGINFESVAGYFTQLRKDILTYPIPTDSIYWGKIFFVGGDATRDPVTNELLTIEGGLVDSNRLDDLKALVLADKTLGAWCGLIINKV